MRSRRSRSLDEFAKRVPPRRRSTIRCLQAAVPGDDYCTTFLFDHGQVRASMTYHNLRTYPVKSGTGVLRETVDAPAMERTGAALLGSLGWHGVAEVDFRWDGKAAEPVLIEVNPRFWGGLTQSVASGWDYPYLLYRLADRRHRRGGRSRRTTIAKTETPVMALLATLTEIAQDDTRMEAMRKAFEELKLEFGPGSRLHALRDFFERLKHGVDVKARWEHARSLLARPPQHGVRRPLLGRPAARAGRPLSARRVHEARQDLDGTVGVVRQSIGIAYRHQCLHTIDLCRARRRK